MEMRKCGLGCGADIEGERSRAVEMGKWLGSLPGLLICHLISITVSGGLMPLTAPTLTSNGHD